MDRVISRALMNPWRQYPLLRLIVPIVAIMATGIYLGLDFNVPWPVPAGMLVAAGFIVFLPRYLFPYSYRWVSGLFLMTLLLIISYSIMIQGKDDRKANYFGNLRKADVTWMGEISQPVVQKENTTKIIMKITYFREVDKWQRTEGTALVYIAADPGSRLLCYGDRMVLITSFSLPPGQLNPGGFDYRRYLALKGILRQGYVKSGHWILVKHSTRNYLQTMALLWRDRMLMLLRSNGLNGREFAVSAALLLGYVDEVDSDLMHDYSATGVMHILSVSGMHVGMIFLVLEKLLKFLERRKRGAYIRAGVIIICTWLYALITGLSPAVMRAAAMLSLVVIGKSMKRHSEILNILAASVISLLAWQPALVADPGFQLSYLAVAGIVLLYKPVYDIFVPGNPLVDKIWSIVAVSIAAQLATLPICLYYFHQFPNYFIITNIIVIPLSNLIIYTGILALATGFVPVVSLVTVKGLSWLVWLLNTFIHYMGSLPFAQSKGLAISFTGTVLLYLIFISAGMFVARKNKVWLFVSLSLTVCITCKTLVNNAMAARKCSITVYDTKGGGVIDLVSGKKSISVCNPGRLKDPAFTSSFEQSRLNDGLTGLFEFRQIKEPVAFQEFHYGGFFKCNNCIGFQGKRIMVLSRGIPPGLRERTHCRMKVDYLVITGNPKLRLRDVIPFISAQFVIFDASNSGLRVRLWVKEAHWLGQKYHDVNFSGAFVDNW